MWLNKFLDMTDDVQKMANELKNKLFKERKQKKLTPLEFTIIETIFNSGSISGYDLIQKLNDNFAGTWEAKSGTVYPILSKLKSNGFLDLKTIKSPIGPLKKVYSLTSAGERMLKVKVIDNFHDQIQFVENFLIELASIFVQSVPESEQKEKLKEVQVSLREMLDNIIKKVPLQGDVEQNCPGCGVQIESPHAMYCQHCGTNLAATEDDDEISHA